MYKSKYLKYKKKYLDLKKIMSGGGNIECETFNNHPNKIEECFRNIETCKLRIKKKNMLGKEIWVVPRFEDIDKGGNSYDDNSNNDNIYCKKREGSFMGSFHKNMARDKALKQQYCNKHHCSYSSN